MRGFSPSREQAGVNIAFIVRGMYIYSSWEIKREKKSDVYLSYLKFFSVIFCFCLVFGVGESVDFGICIYQV